MPTWRFQVRTANGETSNGEMDAPDASSIASALASQYPGGSIEVLAELAPMPDPPMLASPGGVPFKITVADDGTVGSTPA